ncbi:MAG: CAP domain-containing protein [Rhodobacteraceae bacterium]|jgi:Ca2+-binding RTX toxin-like protein|nr:CAP domain-containing protein [Paracoccaceae bacterium]
MPLNANEQYLLELINRGRLDPVAEAARYGVDLNAGVTGTQITTAAKQVLAPNALLESAASAHSNWMLATDTFSHTGQNGSSVGTRATAVNYNWSTVGENIAVWGTTGTLNTLAAIDSHHQGLFLSVGHRLNLMNSTFSEIGLAQETGRFAFTAGGTEMNASMLTEMFGRQSNTKFLTGVVFDDSNANNFYTVGEGRGGTSFGVAGASASSEAAGGYSLRVASAGPATVEGNAGSVFYTCMVDFSIGNVKLDIMNGSTFNSSASIWLSLGINNANLLGNMTMSASGNANGNVINGNGAFNYVYGYDGNDVVNGAGGNDAVWGGNGDDRVWGGTGDDRLWGDAGNDILWGETGHDGMNGGAGSDVFIFANTWGRDVVEDFNAGEGDRLLINDDLWSGSLTADQVVARFATATSAGVVFNFGDGDALTLQGVTSTAGLAATLLFW